jgi:hypothetical protein
MAADDALPNGLALCKIHHAGQPDPGRLEERYELFRAA